MGYTENKPRTFVLKMPLHCINNAKDVKKLVLRKINGVDSVDVIDQEQGRVRISGNVEPQTVIETLKKHMKKHAELLVEDKEEESPPRTNKQEMQIGEKPVREFSDQRKVSPLLPENEPRTFVLKMHLHCKNNAKDVKKLVLKKINGVDSVDVIDQEQGRVRISGNVEPRTVIVMLKSHMKKHAELLVEDEEEESPPRTINQEMQIVNKKPVRKFVDQRKVSPLLPDPIIMSSEVRDCYPAHNHELELKSFNKPFTCSRCMENGFTSGYRCKLCVYDIHKECMNPQPKITHKLFPGSVFEFRQKPHKNRNICDACGMIINGCSYRCEARNLDLHPRCSNLPGKLRIDGTDFVLICKNVEQRCFSCKKKLHSQLAEKEVPGWCYVSECNKFYCHVYCVSQMVQEAWRKGDLVPSDDDDDDGTSKVLEQVNLKLVAKLNGSGGRGGRLFLKAEFHYKLSFVGFYTRYTENKPRTFVQKLHLHCENCVKDVKKFVVKKIKGVDSVDVIDQEQGKVRITGNVDPQTVIEKLKKNMNKYAELLVEEEEEESSPKIENQEMQIVNKSVWEFVDQRKGKEFHYKVSFAGFYTGYTENKPRTFVLKLHLHSENCAKDMKKFVVKKIKGVDSVDVIDQEQGKVRITGNVDPQTVIEKLKKNMNKYAELLVEEEEEEESSPKMKTRRCKL
ncbi:hypothetical protein Vadar_034183 [Vaccinium darrowii]|uniref:Uncharacterized protein n=1 Tax=Vaccinium darrowii TaxID=229202 RepID=A0ACB7YS57_9ERIC|nr:hypothetical protein Vadar_034183 [Vaccinium darrowii]